MGLQAVTLTGQSVFSLPHHQVQVKVFEDYEISRL